MVRLLAVAVLALAVPCIALAGALAEAVKGDVKANGEPLSANQRVEDGSEILTGPGSQLVLGFDDGGKIVLEQNTRFRLVSFRYQRQVPSQDHAVFDLLRGALRTITGALASRNRELYAMRTPQFTIGVRGTDFMVAVVEGAGSFANVVSGQIAVSNGAGTVVFGAGSIAGAASNAALVAPVAASAVPPVAGGAFQSMGGMSIAAGSGAASGVAAGAAAGTGLGVAAPLVVFGAAVAGAAGALNQDDDGPSATSHH